MLFSSMICHIFLRIIIILSYFGVSSSIRPICIFNWCHILDKNNMAIIIIVAVVIKIRNRNRKRIDIRFWMIRLSANLYVLYFIRISMSITLRLINYCTFSYFNLWLFALIRNFHIFIFSVVMLLFCRGLFILFRWFII